KTTVFARVVAHAVQAPAWQAALDTVDRFDRADRLLFSVPMWNGSIPYILKQFVDVISKPGAVFAGDADNGSTPLLSGRGKKAVVVYTSAVWGPQLGPEFG